MKKLTTSLLVMCILSSILTGCGPLSPAPEGTVTPTVTLSETVQPTITLTPTENPLSDPTIAIPSPTPEILAVPGIDYYPSDYTNIEIDPSCMKIVCIHEELNTLGYRFAPFNPSVLSQYRKINQYINYPVNAVDNKATSTVLMEEISYDVVNNRVVDTRPIQKLNGNSTTYNFLETNGTFKTYDSKEEFETRILQEIPYEWNSTTTINKETGGKLSGGIYDVEYKKPFDYAVISNNKQYAFVVQSLEASSDSADPGTALLQPIENGPQIFALLDMNSGEIIKTFSIKMGRYQHDIEFSEDDKHIIIYFCPDDGGGNIFESIAIVIDIEASLAEETPEE